MILINFEGLDFCGKTTLIKSVSEAIGIPHRVTKEPGSPHIEVNKTIREIVLKDTTLSPVARELLFYADALNHRDYLNKQDELFLSDRGEWSHRAYLRGYLKTKQIDYDQYDACRSMIDLVCKEPDAVVYLRGSLDLMKKRSKNTELDAIETNSETFYKHVLETYEDLCVAAEYTGERLLILNAEDSVDNNTKAVLQFIHENFKSGQLEGKSDRVSG